MIPVSNTATRQNYTNDPPSATLSASGRLTFNRRAATIFRSFGVDRLYLSYEQKDGQRILSLSDTGDPGIISYQLQFGYQLYVKSFLNLLGKPEDFYWIGKYSVELYVAQEEDTSKVKSSVIVKLTKVKGILGGEETTTKATTD